jgi:hypothetical protein
MIDLAVSKAYLFLCTCVHAGQCSIPVRGPHIGVSVFLFFFWYGVSERTRRGLLLAYEYMQLEE